MNEPRNANNRKLIRPSLSEVKEQMGQKRRHQKNHQRKRQSPSDQTNAEACYFLKQMQNHTPMALVLHDGEKITGTIEWYDRACVKVNRDGAPNLVVYKTSIKYLYKLNIVDAKVSVSSDPNGKDVANGSAANQTPG